MRVDDVALQLSVVRVTGESSVLLSTGLVSDMLAAAGSAAQAIAKDFPDLLDATPSGSVAYLCPDAGDLIFGKPVSVSTVGAIEFILKPSDRYLELVAAIARNGDVPFGFDPHGWPIPSLVCGNPTIAEAGGASSASGGGQGA